MKSSISTIIRKFQQVVEAKSERITIEKVDGMEKLTIKSTEVTDQGVYKCVAENEAGSQKTEAKLTVEGAKAIQSIQIPQFNAATRMSLDPRVIKFTPKLSILDDKWTLAEASSSMREDQHECHPILFENEGMSCLLSVAPILLTHKN